MRSIGRTRCDDYLFFDCLLRSTQIENLSSEWRWKDKVLLISVWCNCIVLYDLCNKLFNIIYYYSAHRTMILKNVWNKIFCIKLTLTSLKNCLLKQYLKIKFIALFCNAQSLDNFLDNYTYYKNCKTYFGSIIINRNSVGRKINGKWPKISPVRNKLIDCASSSKRQVSCLSKFEKWNTLYFIQQDENQ